MEGPISKLLVALALLSVATTGLWASVAQPLARLVVALFEPEAPGLYTRFQAGTPTASITLIGSSLSSRNRWR